MNLTEQRHATRTLDRPVVGLIPARMEGDVQAICGFVPVAEYGPLKPVAGEIGSVEYVRYIVSDTDELRYFGGLAATMILELPYP